jgi:hypothetical protein
MHLANRNIEQAMFPASMPWPERNATKIQMTEIKLLVIVEALKGMLLGQSIKVYTYHKNLTRTFNRVYQWRLLLEEYTPKIIYVGFITHSLMQFHDLSTAQHLIILISTPTPRLVCPQRRQVHKDGNHFPIIGKATIKVTPTHKQSASQ